MAHELMRSIATSWRSRVAAAGLAVALTSACGVTSTDPTPPRLAVAAGSASTAVRAYSCCWSAGARHQCGHGFPDATGSVLPVDTESELVVDLDVDAATLTATLYPAIVGTTEHPTRIPDPLRALTPSADGPRRWRISLTADPGQYDVLLHVRAGVDDAGYAVRLEVAARAAS
jgi:hypothetical protein